MIAGLAITEIEDADAAAVVSLWERCALTRPWNDPAADIALARKGPSSTILLGRGMSASWRPPWSATMAIAAGSIMSPSIPTGAGKASGGRS